MMERPFDLRGKGAVITGSSRGIGRAIAEALALQGANVIVSSRKLAACEEVAAAINAGEAGRATAVAASIGSKADIERLFAESVKILGGVDILVCNAASNPHYGSMSSISDEQFEKILRNNVLANHWLCQLAIPGMTARGDGSIIIISSIGGYRGSEVIGAYNISKAADMQLARGDRAAAATALRSIEAPQAPPMVRLGSRRLLGISSVRSRRWSRGRRRRWPSWSPVSRRRRPSWRGSRIVRFASTSRSTSSRISPNRRTSWR